MKFKLRTAGVVFGLWAAGILQAGSALADCGACRGDVNSDGVIDILDLVLVLNSWGQVQQKNSIATCAAALAEMNDVVDGADLAVITGSFNHRCNGGSKKAQKAKLASNTQASDGLLQALAMGSSKTVSNGFDLCVADLNRDGQVDKEDKNLLIKAWGTDSESADFNRDRIVDGHDLSVVLAAFGTEGCGVIPPPILKN